MTTSSDEDVGPLPPGMDNRKRPNPSSSKGKGNDSDSDSDVGPMFPPKSKSKISGNDSDNDDDVVGPLPPGVGAPSEAGKKKALKYQHVYLENLPSAEMYERSYMHRDIVNDVVVTNKTNFIVTTSADGHLKFWKKGPQGIEFVKHFRAHMGSIVDATASNDGLMLASISDDKTVKIFDVINFDMINQIKLDYIPLACCWVHTDGAAKAVLAISDAAGPTIRLYDANIGEEGDPIKEINVHTQPVHLMALNQRLGVVVSVDRAGMVEYWSNSGAYTFPEKAVSFDSKMDTDLYEFIKCKTMPTSLAINESGELMALVAKDRKVRIYKIKTGKLYRVYDESLSVYSENQKTNPQLDSVDFGRRMAQEKEIENSPAFERINAVFDESGQFLLYPTMLGVKVIGIKTNTVVRVMGKHESTVRILRISLYQGKPVQAAATLSLEMQTSENPGLEALSTHDPTMFCTGYNKNRFFLFSRRDREETEGEHGRDVYNEKPSREDMIAATDSQVKASWPSQAIIHTSYGDVHVSLFPDECPKTVENFVTHSRNGYYDNLIFHRVIKSFMIQTGDPEGDGTGGESIWGAEFEDEISPKLRHDRPFTLSMANAGPGTNGSQFFITVVPTPWLDDKHTVFGRVTRGMDITMKISNVPCDKFARPNETIRILNISFD
ncbi:hypothetical protein SARC_06888 [Sphaeroforma arctica JP610]|uniref:peptidylprolyl isomerase n=1 Tax=Sphaeroforma arctica JP610 TaxID=667725 RepID=A0A0L0FW23_9EUKA|nr:hypothetical protein SARC_06888 [Sphaeroforma arctica JP610]KNC80761.1 hypothetical protein SARC_06888 [Sphaeroforma arctica JP610]|eukprot:XP_014154663.1 hypothetical protein SARC_06888 [Sphaeroforma arctica JP610]